MTSSAPELVLQAPEAHAFVGGQWCPPRTARTATSIDPATEEPLAEVAWCGPADVDRAVAAARSAAPAWGEVPWGERAGILREIAARLRGDRDRLALVDTRDCGLPLAGSGLDLDGAARHLEYVAGIGGRVQGDTIPAGPERLTWTERRPYGVVGRILAYNHPLMFAAQGMAAPLLAGNSLILKPADPTALATLELAHLVSDLLPPGVLNVVPGPGAEVGAAVAAHPGIPRVAFTGSVPTGRAVLRAGATHIKHVTLELGGKNPLVVFPDVDPVIAAAAAVDGMNLTRTAGQSCQATSRVLVHESRRRELETAIVERLEALRVGVPTEPTTDMGPLCFQAHRDRVLAAIRDARDDGARLLTGGGPPPELSRGWFVAPTAFSDVDPGTALATEEIFGPVVAVTGWSDEDEMLRIANGTTYGLTANVLTHDLRSALRTARQLEAGMVWVNGPTPRPAGTPFGGVKASGLGRDHGEDELRSYTQEKSVILRF
jgi:betaine-aldehyde dehydrogenase